MWEPLGVTGRRPSRFEALAAAMRQLMRAHDSGDLLAVWHETIAVCMKLHIVLGHLLRGEPSWDSKGRWLDSFSTSRVFLRRPAQVRVADAMFWGLRSNVGGRLWPEPFEADLRFTPAFEAVAAFTIRFGDRRSFPGERSGATVEQIRDQIDAGAVDWALVWNEGIAC